MFGKDIFKGKRVFVTGGGSGIGFAIAKQFLQLGATVFIASRKQPRIEAALETLKQFGDARGFTMDTRKVEEIEQAADHIAAEVGGLDILINNAGGQFPSAAENISFNGWNAVINNNLNGSWYVTQIFSKRFFLPQKNGIVTTIIAGISRGFPGMAHTGAARAGVDNFTKSLAIEWAPYHVRINAVAPGFINSSGMEQYPPELLANINAAVPMRRLGTSDEVAYLTVFLCSPYAAYITGQTMYIDGGQSLWGSMWQVPNFTPQNDEIPS